MPNASVMSRYQSYTCLRRRPRGAHRRWHRAKKQTNSKCLLHYAVPQPPSFTQGVHQMRSCSTQPYQSSECAGTIHVRLFSLAADNGVQVYTADHTSQMLTGFAAGSRWATVCASSPKCTLRCAAGCTPGAQLQHAAL